ncbi:MAG: M28 family peptidase [Acidobacteria bacterium]|nr:M28 family peptidase [Acidobacteriota bacterium]
MLLRSDHRPFMNRGVPGLWFLTGLHPDYHTTPIGIGAPSISASPERRTP